MGLVQEFKEFAVKGNVVDMAVGVIIGAAFGKIVGSLVSDVIMPPLGVLMGGVDFKDLAFVLKESVRDAAGKEIAPAVQLKYGVFLDAVFQFLIVAFTIFAVIKAMNRVMKLQKKPA